MDSEYREGLLGDWRATGPGEHLAEAFAGADPEKLSAALQAGDLNAALQELGLTDEQLVQIAESLSQARADALRHGAAA